MDNIELLTKAVEANPNDIGARLALSDAIGERDTDAEPLSVAVWVAAYCRCYTVEQIGAMLSAANGRRRVRTLDIVDVVQVCKAACKGDGSGWAARGGGTVANSYNYPAEQTVVLAARRSDGSIRLAIGTTGAKKGNSLTNWASRLTIKAKPEEFRAWADTLEVVPV